MTIIGGDSVSSAHRCSEEQQPCGLPHTHGKSTGGRGQGASLRGVNFGVGGPAGEFQMGSPASPPAGNEDPSLQYCSPRHTVTGQLLEMYRL